MSIETKLEELRGKLRGFETEQDSIVAAHGEDRDGWAPGIVERYERVTRAADKVLLEYDALSERGEKIAAIRAGIANGTMVVDSPPHQLPDGTIVRSGIEGRQVLDQSTNRWHAAGPQVGFLGDPWAAEVGSPLAARTTSPADLRARALTAVERMPGGVADDVRQALTVDLQGDQDPESRLARYTIEASQPAYLRAFTKWMREPERGHLEWSPEERAAYTRVNEMSRAMSLGTNSAGGFLTPVQLDPQILLSSAGSVDPMRQLARVETTAQNTTQFVTSAGVTASWDAEAAEVSDDSPTLAQPSISAFKGAAFVPVSIELFEDSNIAQQVGALFVDAKAQLEATAFTTGTGSAQPKGVITAVAADSGSVVLDASGTALTVANIVANQNALPARWRAHAVFMANLSMINAARQLPKGTDLVESAVNDSTSPPTCFGWKLYENSTMDGTIGASTTNDYVWLSGDFRNYIIVDRVGTSVEFVPHLFGDNQRPTGQRGFYMHWRTGGDCVITDAFRLTNYSG